MTLKEFCKMTENSTNNLVYIFKDNQQYDSNTIKAKTIMDFLILQNAEILHLYSTHDTDYVTLDIIFEKHCEIAWQTALNML